MTASFTVTIDGKYVSGSKRVTYGRYTAAGGSTGGDISTTLHVVEFISLQPTGSAVATNASVANETFPLVDTAVTVVVDANQTGLWRAEGR